MSSFRAFSANFRRSIGGWSKSLRAGSRPIQRALQFSALKLWNWGRSRNWVYFLQGLPALVMSIAVIVVVSKRYALSSQELEARYLDKAQKSFKAATEPVHYSVPMVCYERLASMGQDRPENLFDMAIAYEALRDWPKAFKLMSQIAPDNKPGYHKAHVWWAIFHMKNVGGLPPDKQREMVEKHLNFAIEAKVPDVGYIYGLLGQHYLSPAHLYQLGENEAEKARLLKFAEEKLKLAINKDHPEFRLKLAQAFAMQKMKREAVIEANTAALYFKERAEKSTDPKEAKDARIFWAESLAFLEKHQEGINVLRAGPDLPEYRETIAKIYLTWSIMVEQNEKNSKELDEKIWSLLERGLSYDPANPMLLMRVMQYVTPKEGDDLAVKTDERLEHLRKVLASRGADAMVHFLMGLGYFNKADMANAHTHWELAYKSNPRMPTIANNLAYILALDDPKDAEAKKTRDPNDPKLKRALEIIQNVVTNFPDEYAFRETRAQVYMKQQKWKDALTDFEYIQRTFPTYPGIHRNLALIYERLGDRDMAAEHRKQQQEIDDRAKTQTK